MKTYKVIIYQEGGLSSFIFGSAKVKPEKMTAMINEEAEKGWRVVAVEKEMRRMGLLWQREAFLIILEKDI